MIDIHSHVLPGIDDGPGDWEGTMAMVHQAAADGITEFAITHHILSNLAYEREDEIKAKFQELKKRISQARLNIKAHLGSEIYAQVDMELFHTISTYNNNKKYFLVEFPMQDIPKFVAERFFDLILDGMVPIIAHPERNGGIIRYPERAFEFVQRGALLQMNAGSIVGRHGGTIKQTAVKLLDCNLIHFISTDAHNTTRRPFRLKDAFDLVSNEWGEDRAELLFRENPSKAIAGKAIAPPEPLPLKATRKSGLLNPFEMIKSLIRG
ncbi:MAG: tyrosine-protein phosphatase [bacterium]